MSMSPTITSPAMMTGVGVLLGTAAYMAPEQARGKAVDKRADIWAFGCVLYEILTGKCAFRGDETADIIVNILSKDPDWGQLPASTAPSLRQLLARCLVKDPRQRWRDIGDARIQLQEMNGGRTAEPATITRNSRNRSERAAWTLATAAIIIAIAAIALASRRTVPTTGDAVYRASILPPAGINIPAVVVPSTRFALSPDGKRVAFVAPITRGRR